LTHDLDLDVINLNHCAT